MSVCNPKNMRDMGVLRRIANKSGEKIVNIGEQLTDLDFLAELSVHSVGKLLGAFATTFLVKPQNLFRHRLNPSVGRQYAVRFLSWRPRHSVRAVPLSLVLSMRRVRARGRRASPLQWWLQELVDCGRR